MISIKVDDAEVKALLQRFPKEASRALERAIDKTAVKVKDRVVGEMPKVFDKPTPFTLNSLKVTKTKGHNMTAIIGFKEPARMAQHYLFSEVMGGQRRDKGLEVALGKAAGKLVPARGTKLNAYGNVTGPFVKELIAKLNSGSGKTSREYVFLPNGKGRLSPGIYQRIKGGKGFGRKTTKTLPFGAWQPGRQRARFGRTANYAVADARGVMGRGLKPIMLKGRNTNYKARLPFYALGAQVVGREFPVLFAAEFAKVMGHV